MEDLSKPRLISKRNMPNNVELAFYDESRKMAGDRWLVKVRCEAVVPVSEEYFTGCPEEDPVLLEKARKYLGKTVSMTVNKERVFVPEEEVDKLLSETIDRVSHNMISYVSAETFPQKLFITRFNEIKQRILIEGEYGKLSAGKEEDDGGPVDFSYCFKD